jgi:CspA family cold shock protein
VVHFDLARDAKDYLHRSGRTARAGAAGTVVSFVDNQNASDAAVTQRALGLPTGLVSPDRHVLVSITPDAVSRRTPSGPTPSPATRRGAIKWFDSRKGFGFIERQDGDDLFVHCSAVAGGVQRIEEGQIVDFEVGPGRKGEQATNVRLLACAS